MANSPDLQAGCLPLTLLEKARKGKQAEAGPNRLDPG
jgi:hypothetical protein